MRFDILTLHPPLCAGPLDASMIGRARERGLVTVDVHDMREHAEGRHRVADDTPYGGGSGMVLRVDVVDRAIEAVRTPGARVLLMDPAGVRFTQRDAERLSTYPQLILVCGHYEGIDARVREHFVDEAVSIGDFVLTGGELAALVVVDAVARLVPGVLGNADSARHESFSSGLLEAPQYTRPREWRGLEVPEILLSGHHANIEAWRAEAAAALTARVRPDLLAPGVAASAEEDTEGSR